MLLDALHREIVDLGAFALALGVGDQPHTQFPGAQGDSWEDQNSGP